MVSGSEGGTTSEWASWTRRSASLQKAVGDRLGVALFMHSTFSIDRVLEVLAPSQPSLDDGALEALVGTLCAGESWLMRHPQQLFALRSLLPTLPCVARGEALRVWSAGCGTGEELYSILAALESELGSYPVEAIGTDVNPGFVAHARKARYLPWSLRGVDPYEAGPWLEVHDYGAQVHPRLVGRALFREHNLSGPDFPRVHVVFCRDVLSCFTPTAARGVFERLAASLAPGGLLFLGEADPAPDSDDGWTCEHIAGVRYYRRGEAARAKTGDFDPVRGNVLRSQPPPASRVGEAEARRALARALAGQGKLNEALALLEALMFELGTAIDAYVLIAILALENGDAARALRAAHTATLLDPDLPMPQLLLARALRATGEDQRARTCLHKAREALAQVDPPSKPLPHAEGLTAHMLTRMVEAAER